MKTLHDVCEDGRHHLLWPIPAAAVALQEPFRLSIAVELCMWWPGLGWVSDDCWSVLLLVFITGKWVHKAAVSQADFTAHSPAESSNQENGGFLPPNNNKKKQPSKTEVSLFCVFPTQNCCQQFSADLLRFSKHQGEQLRQAEFINPRGINSSKREKEIAKTPGVQSRGVSFKWGCIVLCH